jgi:hypothetical protein
MSSKIDKQHYTFYGDGLGTIYRRILWNGESELLFTSNDGKIRQVVINGDLIPPAFDDIADTLKISGVVDLTIIVNGCIKGGYEDCIDINHSHNIRILAGDLDSGGNFIATIKGGSSKIDILFNRILNHGKETDFDLGNWSDQSNAPTKNVRLQNVVFWDGFTKVRVLTAEMPTLVGSFKVNSRWRHLFLPVMKILKKLHLA